jgi:apolipoprotein N-acyltransferase
LKETKSSSRSPCCSASTRSISRRTGWPNAAQQSNWWLAGGNLGLAAVALAFTLFFFDFPPLAQRPILLFSFVFLIDLAVAALAWLDEKVSPAQPVAGLAVFGLLAVWTSQHLTNELLNPALAFYLVFAVFHSALPAWLQRRRGVKSGVRRN